MCWLYYHDEHVILLLQDPLFFFKYHPFIKNQWVLWVRFRESES
ncbi:hypothetical protein JCM19297_3590 [Nonlabens ulvanivorans]|nr:hypothetical protein JCM19297_3590 [Nonlabens ulvanivorans]